MANDRPDEMDTRGTLVSLKSVKLTHEE
jgi:hypothetical protein